MFSKQVTDSKVYNWFQERLEIEALAEDVTSKYPTPSISSTALVGWLTCFLIQFATGFAMTFYYSYGHRLMCSLLMTEVNFGWLIARSTAGLRA